VLVLKCYLKSLGLNEVASGGLSSYSLCNMVIAHLQEELKVCVYVCMFVCVQVFMVIAHLQEELKVCACVCGCVCPSVYDTCVCTYKCMLVHAKLIQGACLWYHSLLLRLHQKRWVSAAACMHACMCLWFHLLLLRPVSFLKACGLGSSLHAYMRVLGVTACMCLASLHARAWRHCMHVLGVTACMCLASPRAPHRPDFD